MLFLLRMLLMGLHFMLAGVLGVLVGLCRPFNPDNSRLCARLYALPAMWILRLNVKADVDSLRNKPGTCVIIANHQSNYDLFVFGNVVPHRTVCIAKKSLKWVPLFGQLFWLAGNVLIDRGNAHKARRAMLTTTHTLQHEDTSIWVFPEGTRNLGKGLLPFKKGAFHMAIAARCFPPSGRRSGCGLRFRSGRRPGDIPAQQASLASATATAVQLEAHIGVGIHPDTDQALGKT